jgi:hypothetical protein
VSRPATGQLVLRIAALPLVVAGVVVHLWISAQVGLAVAAAGVVAHLAAALLGRRWLRQRRTSRAR